MKEYDDTENEEVMTIEEEIALLRLFVADDLDNWMKKIEKRVANLEARKPPQDTNPDPEWFS